MDPKNIKGLTSLVKKLQGKAASANSEVAGVSVLVGYTAKYAIYVHEGTGVFGPEHKPIVPVNAKALSWMSGGEQVFAMSVQGSPGRKFLEGPARLLSNSGELNRIISTALQRGSTLAQALVLAGLRIQRESQKNCPVDTGNLKNSAFTRLEGGK